MTVIILCQCVKVSEANSRHTPQFKIDLRFKQGPGRRINIMKSIQRRDRLEAKGKRERERENSALCYSSCHSHGRHSLLHKHPPGADRDRSCRMHSFNLITVFAVWGNKARPYAADAGVGGRGGGGGRSGSAMWFSWIMRGRSEFPAGALEQGAAELSGAAKKWDSCLAHVSGRRNPTSSTEAF